MNHKTKMSIDPTFPTYAQNKYDSFYLLRFFDTEEHRQSFIDGTLYMRTQTSFAHEKLGEGRSDIAEGADLMVIPYNNRTYPDIHFTEENGAICVEIIEYSDKPENYTKQPLFISYPESSEKKNLFCMYTFWYDSKSGKHEIVDAARMKKFGEYGVIILNHIEFFNRVAEAANKDNTVEKLHGGFVNYIPDDNINNVMVMNPFVKYASNYSYQNEFRFCADTDNTNLLELKLEHSLEDIVWPINLETFSNTVMYKDNQFTFIGEKREKYDCL